MTQTSWTYLPLPWPGARIDNGSPSSHSGGSDVFALRVSSGGLAEVMDGSGKWWRVGRRTLDGYGSAHDGTLTVTTAYTHDGDM